MEFQEFKAIANGSSVFFLIALTLLLENGSSAVSESEEAELKSVLAKGLHNFFSDEALGEVVCLAKSLSGIAPSELVDYIQQCDPIVHARCLSYLLRGTYMRKLCHLRLRHCTLLEMHGLRLHRRGGLPCQVFAASQSQSPGWQGDLSLSVKGTTET